MKRSLGLIALIPTIATAQSGIEAEQANSQEVIQMASLSVIDSVAANDMPSAGYATPVTSLRYVRSVDVQSRGFAETQSDVVIRGGIFENTGFKLGAINLYDPQTGHYSAELPVDPMMLSAPKVLTGVDNAAEGLNSSVGTVSYSWLPISNSGVVEAGFGSDSLYFGRIVSGYVTNETIVLGRKIGVQFASSYSDGNGTIDNTDHKFQRYGLRVQLANESSQTDIYAGYQKKFYGWPGMYTTSAAYPESDKYEVALLLLNHTQNYAEGSHWSVGAYSRKLLDDYELNRTIPGYYRPYLHKTLATGLAAEGTHKFTADTTLDWRMEGVFDEIESTELTHAGFMSRSYWKSTVLAGHKLHFGSDELLLEAGFGYEDSNRDTSGTNPMARATYSTQAARGTLSTYVEYSRATQLSGYTAIGSSQNPGSFAGNADLGRERADNYEVGILWNCCQISLGGSVFYRTHIELTDWTYDSSQARILRRATPMDMDVTGFELFGTWKPLEALSLTMGYTYLDADPDYYSDDVDASFYAMNYPTNRFTASCAWDILENLTLSADADLRHQERNALRSSGNDADFYSASIAWSPTMVKGLTLSLIMDNITDCDFQYFPGVPANGRQAAFRLSYTW